MADLLVEENRLSVEAFLLKFALAITPPQLELVKALVVPQVVSDLESVSYLDFPHAQRGQEVSSFSP